MIRDKCLIKGRSWILDKSTQIAFAKIRELTVATSYLSLSIQVVAMHLQWLIRFGTRGKGRNV